MQDTSPTSARSRSRLRGEVGIQRKRCHPGIPTQDIAHAKRKASRTAGPRGRRQRRPGRDIGFITFSNARHCRKRRQFQHGPSVSRPTATDPQIEALNLAPTAKNAAYELKKKHPAISFTSGRRNKADQARAMAGNVARNRKWIEQTYTKSPAREKCQKWVNDDLDKITKEDIKAGLASVLEDLTNAELARFSKPLSGDAFDVQPEDADANRIKKAIRSRRD